MNSEDFRTYAHEFADWMADYLDEVERYPVRANVRPGEIAAKLPPSPPEGPEAMSDIFRDFQELILPGMTHWQHPGFFAYFPANSSPPSVLAEMLTAALGAQCMSWQTSPAATELETLVLDWLRQMIGLPEGFMGAIQDTASTATLCAIVCARERATDFGANGRGLSAAKRLTSYCSAEAHSSVEKGVKIAGLGAESLRKIATDEALAMKAPLLERAIEADLEAGLHPALVVATLGTTGAGGVDPLRAIGEICRRYNLWLHVDAAWAGSALVLPHERWMIDGIDYADSFVFNPHKWLLTNFDCSAYFVRDPQALIRSLEISPEYLKTGEDERVINYRDWGLPLGRRFRALKLWFVIRAYGVEGLKRHIAAHIEMARELAAEIAEERDFEILAPARLALVCFRYRPHAVEDGASLDRLNEALLGRLNQSGRLYLSHARVGGAFALRFCVGQTGTRRDHVMGAWQRIREEARALEPTAAGAGRASGG